MEKEFKDFNKLQKSKEFKPQINLDYDTGQEILDFLSFSKILESKKVSKQFEFWSNELINRKSEAKKYYEWEIPKNTPEKEVIKFLKANPCINAIECSQIEFENNGNINIFLKDCLKNTHLLKIKLNVYI